MLNIVKNNRGSTLVIVIAVMTILLAGVFSFSKMFSNSIRNNKNLNNKYISRYASESGVERVYYLKNSLAYGFENIINDESLNNGTIEGAGGAKYILRSNNHKLLVIPSLEIANEYNIILNKTTDFDNIKSVKISWDSLDASEQMEFKFNETDITNPLSIISTTFSVKDPNENKLNLDFINKSVGSEYALTMKAIGYKLHNINVVFYDGLLGAGNPVVINSIQGVESAGSFLNNEQVNEMTRTYIEDRPTP